MSQHIKYSHQYRQCSAYYMPFEEDVLCPNCGVQESEIYSTFISEAADSSSFNLQSTGYYQPDH